MGEKREEIRLLGFGGRSGVIKEIFWGCVKFGVF